MSGETVACKVYSNAEVIVSRILSIAVLGCLGLSLLLDSARGEVPPQDLTDALAKVRAVGAKGAGHRDAAQAVKVLAKADADQLPKILAAMQGANDLAANWLRGVVEAAAQRAKVSGQKLPQEQLEKFLADTRESPRARRLAYELIASVDDAASTRLIPTLIDDPSLELRRDAVAAQLEKAEKLKDDKAAAIGAYQTAFHAARDLDQIKAASKALRDLGENVDVARQMGFINSWKIIGPFDNVGDVGWDTAYPPEKQVDFAAEYDGQKGKIQWIDHTTTDDFGAVDLTKALDKHKGAVAYAAAEFIADEPQRVDIRIGSVNAIKVFVNGTQIDERHVYHSGAEVDQYVSQAELKKGKNVILVKICQNEQTDAWAQDWKFQLRVCNEIGTAVLSQDRPTSKTAMREDF